MELVCPLCGGTLQRQEKRYVCPDNHSFDIARQGYVHLLPVQNKHSRNPGDTREQVLSRRAFLESGYYAPIADALAETLGLPLTGLDISKEAVRCAAAKYKGARWLCATASHIPVPDGSAALLMSLFAITLPEEFHRVLEKDGYFFQVLAAQDHLLGLKSVIYPELKLREKDSVPELPGFELVKSRPIRFSFTVEGAQIQNLFSMTPHVFRIGKEGAQRLAETQVLTDTASCVLNIYRRS